MPMAAPGMCFLTKATAALNASSCGCRTASESDWSGGFQNISSSTNTRTPGVSKSPLAATYWINRCSASGRRRSSTRPCAVGAGNINSKSNRLVLPAALMARDVAGLPAYPAVKARSAVLSWDGVEKISPTSSALGGVGVLPLELLGDEPPPPQEVRNTDTSRAASSFFISTPQAQNMRGHHTGGAPVETSIHQLEFAAMLKALCIGQGRMLWEQSPLRVQPSVVSLRLEDWVDQSRVTFSAPSGSCCGSR